MASPNLTEIVTTTLRHRTNDVKDNWSGNTALMDHLRKRGKVRPFSGGREISEAIAYQKNQTFKRFSGYDTLDIQPTDHLTAATYGIKQAAVAISMSGLERLQNSGKEQIIDLLAERIDNGMETLVDELSSDLYSDGTADGGRQINGLQAIVADTGGGTVGGIDSSTYTFWQNQYEAIGGAFTAANIEDNMRDIYVKLVRKKDRPDLIVTDNAGFTAYWDSLQAIQRVMDSESASRGYKTITYMHDIPVILDGGMGGDAPSERMYFLNCRYLHWRPHSDQDFAPLGDERMSTNQDAFIRLFGWAGNLSCSNRSLQGVITGNI